MKKALRVINDLEKEGVIQGYAMGGATALLFYAEPALTFDVDIFVFLPDGGGLNNLVDLGPLYQVLASKGYRAQKEHVLIEGVPVQFIPVYNSLVGEAVKQAATQTYEEVPVKVMTVEHLLAIMLDTNRPKDRERVRQLIETVDFDKDRLESVLKRHALQKRWEAYLEK